MELEDTFIKHFNKKLSERNPESFEASREIINQICDNILSHYEYIDFMNSKRQTRSSDQSLLMSLFYHKKEQDEKVCSSLADMVDQPGFISRIELQNEFLPRTTKLEHLKVHKQFVGNLCGYHASYNLIQAIHSIKYQIPIQFENVASFWTYVSRTQSFLKQWAEQHGKDRSQWPWTDEDISQGDFERTYLKVVLQYKPLFQQTFSTEISKGVKFYLLYNTLYFQYENILNSFEERTYFQKQINEFLKFKADEKNQMIFACMMGVTTHWVSFIAQKSQSGASFYFMDSRNREYLLWNEEQMKQYIIEEDKRRETMNLKPFSEFQKDIYLVGMKDIQLCVSQVCSWLTGQSTIEEYVINSKLKVFMNPLLKHLGVSTDEFMKFQFNEVNIAQSYVIMNNWAEGYRHTIDEYLYIKISSMSYENVLIVRKAVQLLEQIFQYQKANKLWVSSNNKKNRIEFVLQSLKTIQNRL